jgi:hypothetical protein
MSGDWRRLHRVCGVSGCSPEKHCVPWFIHKAKTEEPKTEVQQHRTGLTGGYRSDRLLTVKFRQPSHEFSFGVDISFKLYPLVVTPLEYQVHSCMSVLEFSIYAGF